MPDPAATDTCGPRTSPAVPRGTLVRVEETWSRAWQAEVRAWAGRASATPAPPGSLCHVGLPGGDRVVLPQESALVDLGASCAAATSGVGLRADLVERALDAVADLARVRVWVARTGPLDLGDVEAAWHAAARHALGRHGAAVDTFVVLNPTGWLHVASGERHAWRRPRPPARATATAAPSPFPWDVPG
ncbi:MAG: hypothetical protein JWR20_1251 [Marmoricola sp.]|nr:hypothetical protein [Marmoricola sp.]